MASQVQRKSLFANIQALNHFLVERASEPLHTNILSLMVAIFGSFRAKVAFDIVPRRCTAYGMLQAADEARMVGLSSITVIEIGVASGVGLFNMCDIAKNVARVTGVDIQIVGFDLGSGLPAPKDYRDHPEVFHGGEFAYDSDFVKSGLPSYASLVVGDVSETIPKFIASHPKSSPIGYVAVDVDYYSSTKEALKLFTGAPSQYLPCTYVFFDDIAFETTNNWCGETLAIREFNDENDMRKLESRRFRRYHRIFKNAAWLDQFYTLHVLDHPLRQANRTDSPLKAILDSGV